MTIAKGVGEFRACCSQFHATEKCPINTNLCVCGGGGGGGGVLNTKLVPIHRREAPKA